MSPLSDGVRKYYEPHKAARLVCEYVCVSVCVRVFMYDYHIAVSAKTLAPFGVSM